MRNAAGCGPRRYTTGLEDAKYLFLYLVIKQLSYVDAHDNFIISMNNSCTRWCRYLAGVDTFLLKNLSILSLTKGRF